MSEEQFIRIIKSLYGKEACDNDRMVFDTDNILVAEAWWVLNYETLEDLEKNLTDKEILELYEEYITLQNSIS